ncbi:MAG: hypothetical protein SH850_29690 [Planctomycetaceae bacterium]|nr:hypothetical protein [Planctomycetaceae bacterium]
MTSVNYFAHALPHLDRPYFLAGTALPDWLSVVDRKLRLRPKLLEPHCESEDAVVRELALGAMRHLDDDGWFHVTRGFAETTAELGLLFRERLRGSDGFRCGFLGHIVTELLLDAALIERDPVQLDVYYEQMATVDPHVVAVAVELMAGRPAEHLAEFVTLYLRERILWDYRTDEDLLRRLNQVLRRVKLSPLPAEAAGWLSEARVRVTERLPELLPSENYPFLLEAAG